MDGAPIVANRVVALLSKMFSFALDRDLVTASPAVRMVRPGHERQRDPTRDDEGSLRRPRPIIGLPASACHRDAGHGRARRPEVAVIAPWHGRLNREHSRGTSLSVIGVSGGFTCLGQCGSALALPERGCQPSRHYQACLRSHGTELKTIERMLTNPPAVGNTPSMPRCFSARQVSRRRSWRIGEPQSFIHKATAVRTFCTSKRVE